MAYEIRDHDGKRLVHDKAFVNGIDLAYAIGGPKDAPGVMLVHGVPKSMFFWRKVIPFLTPRYRVCVVDVRGFGDSERPVTGYDSNLIASDLIGIADQVGFKTFRIIGEDWGAAFAYTLAATYRDRIEQLVFQEMILPGLGYDVRPELTLLIVGVPDSGRNRRETAQEMGYSYIVAFDLLLCPRLSRNASTGPGETVLGTVDEE
jgi:pimeloyl-ACP methyl ester carboxylesterase